MQTITLTRIEQLQDCTRGVLVFGDVVLFTLEPPWRGNKVNVSCIPGGDYLCELDKSPRYGLVYHVRSVTGRTHILFHVGNVPGDTEGCILPGSALGRLSGNPAVLSSRIALNKLHDLLNGNSFILRVIDVPIRNSVETLTL